MAADNSRPYKDIGNRIADRRRELGRIRGEKVTQEWLAAAVGVAKGTVTAWEIGKQRPEGTNLVRLAEALDTSPDAIVGHALSTRVIAESRPGPVEQTASDLFDNFDSVVRHLRGVAPPGQSKARKLAAVEGIERTAIALGWELPDWFFDLPRQINEGEL